LKLGYFIKIDENLNKTVKRYIWVSKTVESIRTVEKKQVEFGVKKNSIYHFKGRYIGNTTFFFGFKDVD
jgi:hypothetical protein